MRKPLLLACVVSSLGIGCADRTPARIELSQSSATLFDQSPTPLGASLVNTKGEKLTTPTLTYSSSPAEVARVGDDGTITCLTSGSASVVIAGGGQSATMSVTCNIVEKLNAPSSVRLILGRAPEGIAIEAMDAAGRSVPGAPINATISNPGLVNYASRKLTPKAVGNTTVLLSSGKGVAQVSVSVVELIKSEPVAIADGASVTWTLQQGHYELDLKVEASNRSRNGLVVSWVGVDCPLSSEAQQHNLKCSVPETASITLRNPTAFGLGASVTGFINLYRTAP